MEPDQKLELDNYWVLTSMVFMDTGCQHPWLPIGVGGLKTPVFAHRGEKDKTV